MQPGLLGENVASADCVRLYPIATYVDDVISSLSEVGDLARSCGRKGDTGCLIVVNRFCWCAYDSGELKRRTAEKGKTPKPVSFRAFVIRRSDQAYSTP
jgi:hypothetical protein